MQTINLIQEIQRLPLDKKFWIIEETIKSIKHDEINQKMELAVKELYNDYVNDKELTAFSSLDIEIFMKQSEIWLIDLDPTQGAEIQKKRPAIIVNEDSLGKLPLKVIVPITDWKPHYEIAPWMVKIGPNNINCYLQA